MTVPSLSSPRKGPFPGGLSSSNSNSRSLALVLVVGLVGGFLAGVNLGGGGGNGAGGGTGFTAGSLLLRSSGGGISPAWEEGEEKDGWKVVHVFYGTSDHLLSASKIDKRSFQNKKYFAQAGQDQLVAKLFRHKRDGYFLDVAANDAVMLSNTYALERLYGWTGICVEAGAAYWLGLAHRACHVIGAVAGRDREDVTYIFRDSKPSFSGIVGEDFDNKANERGRHETRRTVTLQEIFRRVNAPRVIDYFSFDVEGAEDLVLQPSVLKEYRFTVLTIERPKQVLKDLLVANDYVFLKEISKFGETLWAHSLALDDLDLAGAGVERPPLQQQQ